jgi:leucyl/phenylalanyl-tRNA---protein transferase
MKRITWLHQDDPPTRFPPLTQALDEPPGLLAAGGDLAPARLIEAYRRGIFPWYSQGEPVLWWSPDPREVLFPAEMHISRSLRRCIDRAQYRVTEDQAFAAVMQGCASSDDRADGTWISPAMQAAYLALHELGVAHSIEVWLGSELAGGLYGLRSGRVFCGESMFSRHDNASKVALAWLAGHCAPRGITLIDCQMPSAHLRSLGSRPIPRQEFVGFLGD